MEIDKLYTYFLENPVITTDSRTIEKNSIFFALKGERFDGNEYAEKAINDGARLAVIDNPQFKKGEEYILVKDVLETLQDLARYHIAQLKPGLKVVGLTGSNGKTTTKELIACVLKSNYMTQNTEGNLNNHIGVPLTILKIKKETEIAVVEMGANHHKEIALLASIAMPDVGLITNIGEAHIEGFGSIKGVLEAKSELFDFLMNNKGTICLNVNDELLSNKFKSNNYNEMILYGEDENTIVKGEIIESGLEKQKISLNFSDAYFEFETKLVGSYNLDNFLAAATIGKYFEIPETQIVEALSNYKPNLNRSQFVETENNKLIVDAYNANPTSMEAAIKNFSNLKDDHKVLILGGMKELGDESLKHHQRIVDLLVTLNFDIIIFIGDEFSQVKHSFRNYKTVDELNDALQLNKIQNSTILIKGSRANKLEKAIPFL